MQSPEFKGSETDVAFASRRAFVVHRGQRSLADAAPAANDSSPLHSARTLAGAAFVVSAAAGWIAVAAMVTAPLLAAGEFLSRAGRTVPRRA